MNLTHRVFAILGNDAIIKIPNNKYNRLNEFDKSLVFPDFKNKKVKFAIFLIELKNRKPFRILEEYYYVYEFDRYGRLDKEKYFERLRVQLSTVDFLGFLNEKERNPNVIDATKEFYKKRLETQYQWIPADILKDKLHLSIFK